MHTILPSIVSFYNLRGDYGVGHGRTTCTEHAAIDKRMGTKKRPRNNSKTTTAYNSRTCLAPFRRIAHLLQTDGRTDRRTYAVLVAMGIKHTRVGLPVGQF